MVAVAEKKRCCFMRAAWIAILCLATTATSTSTQQSAQQQSKRRQVEKKTAVLPEEAKDRMRRAVSAVGMILVGDGAGGAPRPRGSGVVVRPNGVIATNWHVIKRDDSDQQYKELFFSLAPESGLAPADALRYSLTVAEIDRKRDLALLRIVPKTGPDGKPLLVTFPFIEIGNSSGVELLDDLVIIGFPEKGGATATLSRGVVEGKDNADGWIKTDARLLHGNSGGAAVNAQVKLIGIATQVEVDRAADNVQLGRVGYLRPSAFLVQMLDSFDKQAFQAAFKGFPSPAQSTVKVRGNVRFAVDGKPIAGARVGLILGQDIRPESVVAWGGTNADGDFQFEKPVPPGRYTLRAKVTGDERYAVYDKVIEIKANMPALIIEVQPAKNR